MHIHCSKCSTFFVDERIFPNKTETQYNIQDIDSGGEKQMNKSDLITHVSEATELSKKDVTKAVDAVFEAISEALQNGDKVQLVGFGNFEVRERSARKGRNPQTGEEIEIPASKIPAFKPGKALKDGIK
jgi:DNA-binding protein HU-beta